jgi:hypothetical protein
MMTIEELLAHLQDKIEGANAEAKESHAAAMNSYGAGYDRGYADALIELQNALLVTQ